MVPHTLQLCVTCGMQASNALCFACAAACHKGHKLSPIVTATKYV